MKRISSPSGSQVNFESTVDKIQEKAFSNLKNRLDLLIGQMGVSLKVNNEASTNELKASLTNSGSNISIEPGKALTPSGEYISISNNQSLNNPVGSSDNTGYGVLVTYKEVGSDPVKALNAFVYDKLGSQSLNRKTNYNDSFELSVKAFSGNLTQFKDSLDPSQVLLAVVWRTAGTFSEVVDRPESQLGNFTIADMREESRLLLSSSLISDDTILFRDRDSIGEDAFGFDIEFSKNLFFNNIEPSETGDGFISTNKLTMTPDNTMNTNLEGTTSEDFYVGVGSTDYPDGRKLVVSDGPLTAPTNLRIFDINPIVNKEDGYSNVTFKWNWADLDGSIASSIGVIIYSTALTGEEVDLGSNVVGRRLLFSSGNSYKIVGVSSALSDWSLQLEEAIDSSNDVIDSNNPATIIDDNSTEYILSITNVDTNESKVEWLGENFVNSPKITIKLALGDRYKVTLQSRNNGSRSQVVTMPGGSYNPDWGDSEQPVESYASPFRNRLPNIPISSENPPTLSLDADGQGFTLEVEGWDNPDPMKAAHAFEVLYSSSVNLSASSFDNLYSGVKERLVLRTRAQQIPSGKPRRYSVAVRPLQNGQAVGDAIIEEISSGGGGVLPEEHVIGTWNVDIEVYDVTVENDSPTGNPGDRRVGWYRRGGTRVLRPPHFAAGEYLTRLDAQGNPILADSYRINEHLHFTTDSASSDVISFPDNPPISVTDDYKTGVSKESRKIGERKFELDYRITRMEFEVRSVNGVSGQNSGIIRVYQRGLEGSGAKMEITGYQEDPIIQTANLPIRTASDGSRTIIIDGFDPDDVQPNNTAEFSGTLTLIGRPFVIDKISTVDPANLRRDPVFL